MLVSVSDYSGRVIPLLSVFSAVCVAEVIAFCVTSAVYVHLNLNARDAHTNNNRLLFGSSRQIMQRDCILIRIRHAHRTRALYS
jgi:hypothetical protein